MNDNIADKRTEFNRLLSSILETISLNDANACEYLKDEGLDPDKILKDGLKKIKQIELQIQARRTIEEMKQTENVKRVAREKTEKLMGEKGFSFLRFCQEHSLAMQFRNLEELTDEEVREALENYFYLEMLGKTGENSDGN